jgi:hypothetical protein
MARKLYAKKMKDAAVYLVQRPLKSRKYEKQVTSFSDNDCVGISFPHMDALVVTLAISNHRIHRILVDTGSLVHILYKSAFDLMKIDREKLVPARYPMVFFLPGSKCCRSDP